MFSIARRAASRLPFASVVRRAIGLTTNEGEHSVEPTPLTRRNSRTNRARRPAPYVFEYGERRKQNNNNGAGQSSRVVNQLRDQYRGAMAVRTRVKKHNDHASRKERSFQRALRAENSVTNAATATASGASTRTRRTEQQAFHILAGEVRDALDASGRAKTREDRVFERCFAELVGDFVAATKVVDRKFAEEVAFTFGHVDEEDFKTRLEKERERVESAIKAREVKERNEGEKRERDEMENTLEEERKLEEIRLTRVREAQLAAEERKEQERSRREREHEARLEQERRLRERERKARIEAERIANLERERMTRLQEQARLARERDERRRRDEKAAREAETARLEAQFRAQQAQWQREADEYARQRLNEYIQSTLAPETSERLNQAFQAQEDRLRAHLEQAAAAQQHYWFYTTPPEQHPAPTQDVPMRDPSYTSIPDVSMASIPDDDPPAPEFVVPKTESDWFEWYESRWNQLRNLHTATATGQLTFSSFPWPVFRLVGFVDQLDEDDITKFFRAKHPGKVDRLWKVELIRWHPDKFERLRSSIRPECVDFVHAAFLKCAKTMIALQEEKARRT